MESHRQILDQIDPRTLTFDVELGTHQDTVRGLCSTYIGVCAEEMQWSDLGELVMAINDDINHNERADEVLAAHGISADVLVPLNGDLVLDFEARSASLNDTEEEVWWEILGRIAHTWSAAFVSAAGR